MSRIIDTLTREGYTSELIEEPDGRVWFKGDLDIDADGAYRAYHKINHLGLDDIGNARDGQGGWCGVVTVHGEPVVQKDSDPAPGYYVSPTSLHLLDESGAPYGITDPRKYVDAETVPFIVVPSQIIHAVAGTVMGCKARITDTRSGRSVECVVADGGPRTKDGEASIAAAKALGIPSSARSGGEDAPVFLYELWPGVPAVVNGVAYPLQPSGA